MASKRRRPQPCGDCGASEKVLASGFDFLRFNPTGPKKQEPAAPPDFDPAACPIIAKHVFGVEPFRQIGDVAAKVGTDLKRQRQVARLHSLGPRPVLEALIEVEAGADLDRVLADFARLDPETVRQLDGDGFWPAPLHEVRRTP